MFNPFSLPGKVEWSGYSWVSPGKNEPEWMLEFRLKSLKLFKMPIQSLGGRSIRDWLWWFDILSKPSDKRVQQDEVPEKSRNLWAYQDSWSGTCLPSRLLLLSMNQEVVHNMKERVWKVGDYLLPIRTLPLKNTQICSKTVFCEVGTTNG